jgi:4-amino-4-deoxy-L-arabinose transferase-like glycosyltransferase
MNDRFKNIPAAWWAAITFIIALRLLFVSFMPRGKTVEYHLEGLNDEPAHYNYVKYLAQNRAFPVLEHFVLEQDAFTRNEFEYHQAPLYYLLCAPLYSLFGEKNAAVACRLIAALAGLLTLWALALLVRDLGYSRRVQFAAVVFAGFLPSHAYFSSFVSNDPLSWLFALLFTRELVRIIGLARHETGPSLVGPSVRTALWLAAGLLTKSSAAIFLPVPLLLSLWFFIKYREGRFFWYALGVTTAASLIAMPWYLRNFSLYHTFSGIPPSTVAIPVSLPSLVGFVKGTVKYFWFPMQHLRGGSTPFMALTVIGGGIVAFHAAAAVWWFRRNVLRRELTAGILFAAALFCLVAVVHAWYYFEWLNPEARFLFPALGPLVVLLVVPMHEAFARIKAQRFFILYCLTIALFPYMFLPFAG